MMIRLVRTWNEAASKWVTRVGPVCECGQMIPYFVQIQPLEREDEYCECCGQAL